SAAARPGWRSLNVIRRAGAPRPWRRSSRMPAAKQTIEHVETLERYKHGFVTDIAQEFAPRGLSEEVIRYISAQKREPEWMLEWRLGAYERWLALEEPTWARVNFPRIDYQGS